VTVLIFQQKSNLAKLSDKTATLLKSAIGTTSPQRAKNISITDAVISDY